MIAAILACAALWGAGDVERVGDVRVVRGGPMGPRILLVQESSTTELAGDLHEELARLQSLKVRVRGALKDAVLHVADYTILDIGRGIKPLVGIIELRNEDVVLRSGSEELVLQLRSRTRQTLVQEPGSKVWIHGSRQKDGKLKVLRYGLLRKGSQEAEHKSEKQINP